MLRIVCPYCGERDHVEYVYAGDAAKRLPDLADSDLDRWTDCVFVRDNVRGEHYEYWQHAHGCRQWLLVVRDTVTHEIRTVTPAREWALVAASGEAVNA
jgi:sarcosine oxidase subunit delta